MQLTEFISRFGLALLLGAAIGFERQWRLKSAGLRTNTLVSGGAAAYILLSASLTGSAGDPSRIASQIVTGIGFLGAGVIMKDGLSVQGLNTAATIWCSAAVGSLAGVGLSLQAVFVAGSVILVHILLRPLGAHLNRLPVEREDSGLHIYFFKIRCREQVENHLRVLILNALKADDHLQLRSLKSAENSNPAYVYVEAEIHANGRHDAAMEKLAGILTLEYGVTEVSWRKHGESSE